MSLLIDNCIILLIIKYPLNTIRIARNAHATIDNKPSVLFAKRPKL